MTRVVRLRPASTRAGVALTGLGLALAAAGCSVTGTPERGEEAAADKRVVLATHESWSVPDRVLEKFTRRTGYRVDVQAAGDAGTLTNKLVLTKSAPTADVAFGVDNTFASRAVEEGVFADHEPADQPVSARKFEMSAPDAAAALTPVDYGDVCVNVDDGWFEQRNLEPPRTFDDLVKPKYRGLFVTPGATTSSPGLAFLLATVAEYGDPGWTDYWEDLVANDVRITAGWTDAYTVDFTAGGGNGDRPIVLSYASSPPFTIPEGEDEPTTSALLDTCYRQVEYAGVLAGAENPEGAKALVDFLVSRPFQEVLPESMYVFPVDTSVKLPEVWARWAETPQDPLQVNPERVAEHRDDWLATWGDITTR